MSLVQNAREVLKRHPTVLLGIGVGGITFLWFLSLGLKSPWFALLALVIVLSNIRDDVSLQRSKGNLLLAAGSLATTLISFWLTKGFISDEADFLWWSFVTSFLLMTGTLATLIWTVVVTQDERTVRMKSKRRSQASKISAWAIRDQKEGFLYVHNASETPIFNLVVSYEEGPPDPKAFGGRNTAEVFFSVVPPTYTREVRTPISADPDCSTVPSHKLLAITFEDSNGIKWNRGKEGYLTVIPELGS